MLCFLYFKFVYRVGRSVTSSLPCDLGSVVEFGQGDEY